MPRSAMPFGLSSAGQALLGATRLAVVVELFRSTDRALGTGELARLTGSTPAAVRRELAVLEREKLLVRSAQNGRVAFRADTRARLFAPLHLLALELGHARVPSGSRPLDPARQPPGDGRRPRIPAALFEQHFTFIAIVMNDWILRHLSRVYGRFQGDLVAALVLGEVAHHNLSQLAPALDFDGARIRDALARPDGSSAMEPCNAFSISEATGIPRETVRRKIRMLVAKGWLTQNARSEVFVAPGVGRDFSSLNFASATELLEMVDTLRARIFGSRRA